MSSTRRLRIGPSWLREYRRIDIRADLRAGATVGVLIIPQSMAYAGLAGVPPIAGLYAAVVGLIVYAALGTSRYISVGPVAIDSLLTAAAVAPLADGDPDRYLALASLTALLVGLIQVGAGVLRLGALINFLSVPVISGFTSAAALTIGISQLKDLLGLDAGSSGTTLVDSIRSLAPALDTIDLATTILGVGTLVALIVLKRLAPALPGPLLAVTVVGLLVALLDLGDRVALVGPVPSGLPVPGLPSVAWGDVTALLPAAAAIALISIMESVSTGSAFARRTRTRIDATREMVAVGFSNAGAGLLSGFPVAGGFSRGAVNFNAGARSQLSGVIAAALVLVALFVLTPLLALLPKVALAAIILAAVLSLVDWRGALEIGRIRRSDLAALLVTAGATLVLGPAAGLGVGAAVSLGLFLRHTASPHMPELGQVPGERMFRNVARHQVLTDPALVVTRIDAPLTFAAARPVTERLERLAARPGVRFVVVDCSAVTSTDFTGVEMIAELDTDLEGLGIELHLAAVRGPVYDVLMRHARLRALEDGGRLHPSVPHAVERLPVRLETPRGPALEREDQRRA
ncbi:sulfate permease [Alteromonas gracilis]